MSENLGYGCSSSEAPTTSTTEELSKTEHTHKDDEEDHHQELTTKKLFEKLNKEIKNLRGENQTLKQKLLHQNVCEICGKGFDTKTQLKEHMQNHHLQAQDTKPYSGIVKCDQCEHRFTTKPLFEAHVRNHHADPYISIQHSDLHIPPLAGTTYNLYKGSFNPLPSFSSPGTEWDQVQGTKHQPATPAHQLHASEAPQQQGPPKNNEWHQVKGSKLKSNTTEGQVQTHEISENPFSFSKVHNCSYCDELFYSQNQLTEHVNKDHPNTVMEHEESENIEDSDDDTYNTEKESTTNVFKCQICNVVQNTKRKLERHLENHDEDGDWICDCEFQTNDYFVLRRHLKQFKTHRM